MHKSAMTLRLVLMGALIIMLVLFTSINFSNVKAQEYGSYEDDKYSKYPTEINKYECRTGPFEGFFVGSVEFCKFNKFDKDTSRDNKTGIQGPPCPAGPPGAGSTVPGPQGERCLTGPTGPASTVPGPQGEQGIPWPNNISTTKFYKQFEPNITGISNPTTGFFTANSIATCLTGDVVLSGGYSVNATGNNFLAEDSIHTEPTSTNNGWTTAIEAANRFMPVSIAYCFDNP